MGKRESTSLDRILANTELNIRLRPDEGTEALRSRFDALFGDGAAAAMSGIRMTAEGGAAADITCEEALERSVMSCMLWEDGFYEDGQAISKRIMSLVPLADGAAAAAIAVRARTDGNIRHAPLLVAKELARLGFREIDDLLDRVILRPDEIVRFLSLYWGDGRCPLSKGVSRGLSRAFNRFDEYQLAKYDRPGPIRLRDALFLCHAKPSDGGQADVFRRLAKRRLRRPDTWETAALRGEDKKGAFIRLLSERRLGYLALLRNLRSMAEAGVPESLVSEAILARRGAGNVLPFRYVAAARACPRMERFLDKALVAAINEDTPMPGTTLVLVDVSGSMDWPLSKRSDMKRLDAAACLASVIPGDTRTLTFSNEVVEIPSRKGMAGVDAIFSSQPHMGTKLGHAVTEAMKLPYDRLVVITDEQSSDPVSCPDGRPAYMINVGADKSGVGYGNGWVHVDGFSESVLRYIRIMERGRD